MSTPRPAERYGRQARPMPSRPVLAVLAALVVLAGLGVAYAGYRNLADPAIHGQVLDWRADGAGRLAVWNNNARDYGVVVGVDGQVLGIARYGQFLSGSACRLIAGTA